MRCQLLCEALAERGPLDASELQEELQRRLGEGEKADSVPISIWDDLTTLRAGKWIEPLPANPERFVLIRDPRKPREDAPA